LTLFGENSHPRLPPADRSRWSKDLPLIRACAPTIHHPRLPLGLHTISPSPILSGGWFRVVAQKVVARASKPLARSAASPGFRARDPPISRARSADFAHAIRRDPPISRARSADFAHAIRRDPPISRARSADFPRAIRRFRSRDPARSADCARAIRQFRSRDPARAPDFARAPKTSP